MTKKKMTKKKVKKTPKSSTDKKLEEIEKRLIRIEKLILLSLDDNILHERERVRVVEIERMVREGEFDKLSELTS